MQAKSQAIGAL
jgi:sporulation protein YlmC with PRC-barrel domain